jgi:hypothetical protein
MNPIVMSALYGGVKGALTAPCRCARCRRRRPGFDFGAHVVAPVREELIYRAGFTAMGVPPVLGAATFAMDHVLGEQHTASSAIVRIMDTMFGAFLYQRAYSAYGIVGAIAAHSLHNIGVTAGQHVIHAPKRVALRRRSRR